MQKAFLVCNRTTKVAEYLESRSIVEIVSERRSLQELNFDKLNIIDVDKFIYIYYGSDNDNDDINFRSDMNALRVLLGTAFFHSDEFVFILSNCKSVMLEDMIFSAMRNTDIPRSAVDIIHHTGNLMLTDVSGYITGATTGDNVTSAYTTVYIKEAESEEKDRYLNNASTLDTVLPAMTDTALLYRQNARIESSTANRIINEPYSLERPVTGFTNIVQAEKKELHIFVVSGERHSGMADCAQYISKYFDATDHTSLVINTSRTSSSKFDKKVFSQIYMHTISKMVVLETKQNFIDLKLAQLGYLVSMMDNISNIDCLIFLCDSEDYLFLGRAMQQLSEKTHSVYTTHFSEDYVQDYLSAGYKSSALFLSKNKLAEEFDIRAYADSFVGTTVATLPAPEDVDPYTFYSYCIGE